MPFSHLDSGSFGIFYQVSVGDSTSDVGSRPSLGYTELEPAQMQEFFWKYDTGVKVVFFLAIVFLFAYLFFTNQKIESAISRLEEKIVSMSGQPPETVDTCGEECQNLIDEKVAEALATLSAKPSQPKVTIPGPSPAVAVTSYLPLGSGGSTKVTDWTALDGSDFIFDLKDYPEGTKVHWNGNLKADVSNSRCFARIYDNSNFRAVDFSEQSTNEKTTQNLTSQPLMIWAGRNTYRVEIKSLNGITCSLGSPRLIFKY